MLDLSSIATALSGATSSLQLAKAALAVNDAMKADTAISDTLQKLIAAQLQVISGNAAFMQLQKEHASLTQTVRELEEQSADRQRYSLFEITSGVFVQRLNVAPQSAGANNPGSPEPIHYLCPRCFNEKAKSVLQLNGFHLNCPKCSSSFWTGRRSDPDAYARSDYF